MRGGPAEAISQLDEPDRKKLNNWIESADKWAAKEAATTPDGKLEASAREDVEKLWDGNYQRYSTETLARKRC